MIDILLATYNGEKYIEELLESIFSQSFKKFRLLICDDCSNDKTYSILKEYEKKDDRIKLYKNNRNLGSDETFEFLLSRVESDFFMIADQDDIWLSDKIEKSLRKLLENNSDLVFTDLEVVDKDLNLIYESFNKKMGYEYKIKKYINDGYKLEILSNVITGCTILAKKEWIEKILPIPKNINILYDYWIGLVISLNGKISYLPEATIKYRQHENNQVGARKYTDTLNTFDELRNHLINLRLKNFETFIQREEIFNEIERHNNIQILKYYKFIKDKKYFCFREYRKFHNIYKTERLGIYIAMFFVINFPVIAKFIFCLKNMTKIIKGCGN